MFHILRRKCLPFSVLGAAAAAPLYAAGHVLLRPAPPPPGVRAPAVPALQLRAEGADRLAGDAEGVVLLLQPAVTLKSRLPVPIRLGVAPLGELLRVLAG